MHTVNQNERTVSGDVRKKQTVITHIKEEVLKELGMRKDKSYITKFGNKRRRLCADCLRQFKVEDGRVVLYDR